MKTALQLCALATNPSAPSPTASMVKVEDNHLIAFGGLFCIRIPVSAPVSCAFNPQLALAFFRKERKSYACSVKAGKLVFQDGKERLSLRCLPPEELPTIDVLAPPTPCVIDKAALKVVADIVSPTHHRTEAQGINFRDGMALGTDSYVFGAAVLDEGFPDVRFNVHVDAVRALLRMRGKITGIAVETSMVKFFLDDGSSLTTLRLVGELPGEVVDLLRTPCDPLTAEEQHIADMLGTAPEAYKFKAGHVYYTLEDSAAEGDLGFDLGNSNLTGRVDFKRLSHLLKNAGKLALDSETGRMLRSVSTDGSVCVFTLLQTHVPD